MNLPRNVPVRSDSSVAPMRLAPTGAIPRRAPLVATPDRPEDRTLSGGLVSMLREAERYFADPRSGLAFGRFPPGRAERTLL
jgi:hypothetical protein